MSELTKTVINMDGDSQAVHVSMTGYKGPKTGPVMSTKEELGKRANGHKNHLDALFSTE
ncbi:hypothetical protein ACF0H5_018342 [Mactra antiquata]